MFMPHMAIRCPPTLSSAGLVVVWDETHLEQADINNQKLDKNITEDMGNYLSSALKKEQ